MTDTGRIEVGSALDGVRVLDLGVGIPTQVASMLLGDFGADVIRVEDSRHVDSDPGDPMWERNKRIITAEISDPRVASLAASADIAITSTANMAALVETARSGNPQLIHLSLQRFRVGEEAAPRSADALMTAASGIARRQSSNDGGPVEAVFPYLSYEQALWGATCAAACLVERERTGLGQLITVDGMHAALIVGAATMVVDQESAPLATAVGPHGPNPLYATYECGDGEWLLLGALLPKFQDSAFALLGTTDLTHDPRIAGVRSEFYAPANRGWVRARIAEAFLAHPCDEWVRLLEAADVPVSKVAEPGEFLDHPQVVHLGLRKSIEDPEVGPVDMPGTPVTLVGTPPSEPKPRQFLSDAHWRSPRVATGRHLASRPDAPRGDGPLAGYRIIDLGAVLAGPFAGSLLGELGADIIKVEPIEGAAFRDAGWHYNRGQRSLAIDLRRPDGLDAFRRIVEVSDLVLDNFRPGVLGRLGIDYDALTAVHPQIISGSITGFGATGPYGGKPAFDPILQAASGMMSAQGGDGPPVFSSIAVNDVTAACALAFGACLSLFHRAHTGKGQRFDVSLTGVAAFMQCGELTRYKGRQHVRRGGVDYQGPDPLERLYATADGFVRVSIVSRELLGAVGLVDSVTSVDDLASAIADAFRGISTAEVIRRLESAGGAVAPAMTYLDLTLDADVLAAGYFHPLVRPDGKVFHLPGRYVRFGEGGVLRAHAAPGPGEHSIDILRDADLDEGSIARLLAAGTVAHGEKLRNFDIAIYR